MDSSSDLDSDPRTKLDTRGHSPHSNTHRRGHIDTYRYCDRNDCVDIYPCTNRGTDCYTVSYANGGGACYSNEHQNTYAIANEHADSDSDTHAYR